MATPREHDRRDRAGRTLAQTFCLAFGITLIVVGVLGFFASSDFSTGNAPPGDELIVFEVNGWHNLVHIASGLLLVLGAANGRLAATVATGFGLVYALVTVWGFVDGNDVFNLIPVNTADNLLHLALTAAALFVGLTSGGLMAASRRDDTRTAARA